MENLIKNKEKNMRNDNKPWKRQGYKSGGRTGKQFGGALAGRLGAAARPIAGQLGAAARPITGALGYNKGERVYKKGGSAK